MMNTNKIIVVTLLIGVLLVAITNAEAKHKKTASVTLRRKQTQADAPDDEYEYDDVDDYAGPKGSENGRFNQPEFRQPGNEIPREPSDLRGKIKFFDFLLDFIECLLV